MFEIRDVEYGEPLPGDDGEPLQFRTRLQAEQFAGIADTGGREVEVVEVQD